VLLLKDGEVMKKLRLFVMLVASLVASSALADKHKGPTYLKVPSGERTVAVIGAIGGNAIDLAHKIERLSAKSKDPIYVVINSPGGSVFAGYQLTQALDIARARDVPVICAVGTMAASMAFQLLPHCTERYAMPNSLLLFHPSRVFVMQAVITADMAEILAREMRKIDRRGLDEISVMIAGRRFDALSENGKKWFKLHFDQETMWIASDLVSETNDGWLKIVDVIDAPDGIFSEEVSRQSIKASKEKQAELDLKERPDKADYIIIN
jgi:ATP-dependent protease ClpP protease subunit